MSSIRRTGVGGSEVPSILGISKWGSPYSVWLRKTGREPFSNEMNKWMEAGIILEDAVASFFERKSQYKIIKASANQKVYRHPEYDFAIGTPDRKYIAGNKKCILECKTTQGRFQEVPREWFVQLQWYLGVCGMKEGAVAWLERGVDFDYQEFEYDKDFFNYMIEEVRKFWHDNVLKDIPPDPINVQDVEHLYKQHSIGKVIPATNEIINYHAQLKTINEQIKALEESRDSAVEIIKTTMLDAEGVDNNGELLFTWRTSKARSYFDKRKFEKEHPKLYKKYLSEMEGSRRFLIK